MLAVCIYSLAEGAANRVAEVYPRHRAHLDRFQSERGSLLLIGPFAEGPAGGSMAVFRTRGDAEDFVAGDPFVTEGVVGDWEVRDWLALDFVSSPEGTAP